MRRRATPIKYAGCSSWGLAGGVFVGYQILVRAVVAKWAGSRSRLPGSLSREDSSSSRRAQPIGDAHGEEKRLGRWAGRHRLSRHRRGYCPRREYPDIEDAGRERGPIAPLAGFISTPCLHLACIRYVALLESCIAQIG